MREFAGGAVTARVEFGRERVEEHRESAPEVTGKGGGGREEVSELCEDHRPSRGDDLAGLVGAGEEVEGRENGWMMVVGVFWLIARGVLVRGGRLALHHSSLRWVARSWNLAAVKGDRRGC